MIEEIEDTEDDTLKSENLSVYWKILRKILDDFDSEYWMKYAGFDAYAYVLLQRKMIRSFLTFFVLNIVLYCVLYFYLVVSQGHIKDFDKLLKMESFSWMNQFYICMSLTMVSIIMIWTIIQTRRQLQASYYYNHINSEIDQGLNYLKLRTIEIESKKTGFEVNGHKITGFIKTALREQGLDSNINSTIVLPDYSQLFDLESKRSEMKTNYQVIAQKKPPINFIIPKELKDKDAHAKKLDELNYLIDCQLTQDVKSSRTVFMCLNSLKSISYLQSKFKNNALMQIKDTLVEAKENADLVVANIPYIEKIGNKMFTPRDNEPLLDSGALDESNVDLDKTYVPHDENQIKVRPFCHPMDINWLNTKATKDDFMGKKILLTIISIAILVFLTTPSALLHVMSSNDAVSDAMSFKWSKDLPFGVGFLVKEFLPPLLVISINSILIFILHTIAGWENHNRFSSYQRSLIRSCFVYFIFNMLIVPGFAAAAFSNLYELVGAGLLSFSSLFRELFELNSGNFFVILVLQQAGFSFLSELTSFSDLFKNYLSPYITLNLRFILSSKETWRKSNSTIFPYGMAYAQQMVIVSIGIVFSGTILVIPLAVAYYFLARHFADSHQLLIWHRAEIESSGKLVHSAMKRLMVALVLAQATTFFKQAVEGTLESMLYVLFLASFTSVFWYYLQNRPLITPDKFPENEEKLDTANLFKWWMNYTHPMVATPNAKLDRAATLIFYEGLDQYQRHQSRGWLQRKMTEPNFMEESEDGESDDNLLEAIAKSKNVGAKPKKNPFELMATQMQNIFKKDKNKLLTPR